MTNEQYYDLIVPYQDALNLLKARLDVLNHSMYGNKSHPIHNIQFRIKQKASIEEKLKRMDLQGSFMNAKEHLQDIAGIRVICYFEKDVELLAEQLRKQSDLILVKEKDYITNPKPNGYRSFHMILGIQVYSMESTEYYPVEVQIRTKDMDDVAEIGAANHLGYEKKQESERARRDAIPQGECRYFDDAYERGIRLQKLDLSKLDVNMFAAVNNSLINDGCGLYRGRLILPYEHLSRFQNDLID